MAHSGWWCSCNHQAAIISKPWKGRWMMFLPLVSPKNTFDAETHVPVANLLAVVATIPVDGGEEGQDGWDDDAWELHGGGLGLFEWIGVSMMKAKVKVYRGDCCWSWWWWWFVVMKMTLRENWSYLYFSILLHSCRLEAICEPRIRQLLDPFFAFLCGNLYFLTIHS